MSNRWAFRVSSKSEILATSKTWTQTLDLDLEKSGPWKIWTLKILDYEKRGKHLDAEQKISRPHDKIY